MAITKNAGRQEALTGYVDVDYTELTTAGKFEIMNLPYGATIVGGSITNGLTGPTDIALSVEDEDGTELQSDMAGTFGAYADIILSLIHISEPTRPTRASRMPSSA